MHNHYSALQPIKILIIKVSQITENLQNASQRKGILTNVFTLQPDVHRIMLENQH